MKKQFALQNEPVAYVVSIHYRNWKQFLKDQDKKSITVKKLLESPYTQKHAIKRHYNNLCLTYGQQAINNILGELFGIDPTKAQKKKAA